MEKKPILEAKELYKSYTHPQNIEILKSVSLKLFPSESIAIMGASGQGKSTLLHILGTLEAPSKGALSICQKPVTRFSSPSLRNQHIGFVFQSFNLLDDYSTLHNVLMPALIAGKDIRKGSATYAYAFELLEKVGVAHRAHFPTKLLSGGEKQRVAIARALCNDPDILLADEPSGNLDKATSDIIHDLLMHCVNDLGKSLIVVTHNSDLAALCNQTLYLHQGILIQN